MTRGKDFQTFNPANYDVRKSARWFSDLSVAAEPWLTSDEVRMVGHAVKFYGFYASTLDQRYMRLTEEFLHFGLGIDGKESDHEGV